MSWLYDERKQCGVDYADPAEAAAYDRQHHSFRDFDREFADLLRNLALGDTRDLTLIDLGCGTGAVTIPAARRFKSVVAVDVSEAMISHLRAKAADAGLSNIECVNAGFLTYRHAADPADIIVTKFAFHHLPDFWKQIALFNMNSMVKPGGIMYIADVVFGFDPADYAPTFDKWVAWFREKSGERFAAEVETHIRDEYSTFDWVLRGMIERAGFTVEKATSDDNLTYEFLCRKRAEIPAGSPP